MSKLLSSENYSKLYKPMCQEDPRLEEPKQSIPSPTSTWLPWHRARPRVVVLHLNPNNSFGPATQYQDPNALQAYLNQRIYSSATPQRSVYILEALSHEFTGVLGSYFQLHHALFADHERLVAFNNRATGEGGGIPFLPSAIHGRDYVSLKYHEPLSLSTLPTNFRNICDVSGRHIAVTKIMGKFSEVVVARRKCTLWSRKTEAGGWDCLIICDPPVKRVLTDYSGKIGYDVTTSPYNAGYVDFMPHRDQIKSALGPPRTSFLHNIIFYLHTHASALDLADPSSLRVFIEKIIASHYLKVAEFTQTAIEMVQFSLSRQKDLTSFAIDEVEGQWSDAQALERRIGEYQDDLEAIMLQLRIPFQSPNLKLTTDWKDGTADYQFLYLRFKEIGQRANRLNGSIVALAGLTNNRQAVKAQELALQATEQSLREAKSVKALTILGVVFIPLAYVASLFSMSDPYRPGGKLFWLYFVVAFPLIGLIVLGYYALELGYTGGRLKWSFRTAVSTAKESLKYL